MAEDSKSRKLLSVVLLAAGLAALIAALYLDFTGSDSSFRGPLLVLGAITALIGLYLFPTIEHHRTIINIIYYIKSKGV